MLWRDRDIISTGKIIKIEYNSKGKLCIHENSFLFFVFSFCLDHYKSTLPGIHRYKTSLNSNPTVVTSQTFPNSIYYKKNHFQAYFAIWNWALGHKIPPVYNPDNLKLFVSLKKLIKALWIILFVSNKRSIEDLDNEA